MAYDIAAGSIWEFQYRYVIAGQQCINVFHYRNGVGFPVNTNIMTEYLTDFRNKIGAHIAAVQSNEVTNITLRGQVVHPVRYVFHEIGNVPSEGASANVAASIGTSVVIRRRSEKASRSSRGRFYIGGIPRVDVTVGGVTAELITALNLSLIPNIDEGLESLTSGETLDPVIWSYTDAGNFDLITSGQVDPFLRYQRRREVGRGE